MVVYDLLAFCFCGNLGLCMHCCWCFILGKSWYFFGGLISRAVTSICPKPGLFGVFLAGDTIYCRPLLAELPRDMTPMIKLLCKYGRRAARPGVATCARARWSARILSTTSKWENSPWDLSWDLAITQCLPPWWRYGMIAPAPGAATPRMQKKLWKICYI